MCGLAGIIRFGDITEKDVDLVNTLNRIQKHRGPDDEGIFSDENCVLGHRRLSIIDLSRDGRQPFASEDGRYRIVFNGEIYNYIELRKELEAMGWLFRTKTDTEVLLKAYQQYGADCLDKLNGMFAFAIYDHETPSVFLARDRVGIKPLYYATVDFTVYFASEIKALCTVPDVRRSINNQSLFDYLVFNRTDVFDETFFHEIRRIPNGHHLTIDKEGMRLEQWWNPETLLNIRCEDSPEKIEETLRELLVSSVTLRMRSDVPVGSCLSGGLDSSILIGILFQTGQAKKGYPTFTASFPGHDIDETDYVRGLNLQYPFASHLTFPTSEKALSELDAFVYANDEPTTNHSFFSQYEVMRLARDKGVTVLLDGQGGDENFAGYQYFHGFNFYGLLNQWRFLRLFSELAKSLMRKQHLSAYQTFAFQCMPKPIKKKLLAAQVPYVNRDFFYSHIESSKIFTDFFQADNLNQSIVKHFQYKLEHLLRMEDRNSMAFALEARVPYLDYRLIEFLLTIPADFKIRLGETKYLQKKALNRFTANQILARKDKIGFGTPGDEWMASRPWLEMTAERYDALTESFPDIFLKGKTLPSCGFDRWKINQLETWRRLFVQGQ